MSKKTWILLKRGLLQPDHRERLGVRVWLYLYMLDLADWDTGRIVGWTDKEHAKDLEMPWRTIQDQRQRLSEDGYITCEPAQQAVNIVIHKWVNPRSYSGKEINNKKGGYGEFRRGGTESSVGGVADSSVPFLIDHIKDPHVKADAAKKPPPSKRPAPASKVPTEQQAMFQALADVTMMDMKLNAGRLGKAAKALVAAEYTPEQVTALYLPGCLWYQRDFRGLRGDPPKPEQVGETIKALMDPTFQDARPNGNGYHKQTTFERNVAGLQELLRQEGIDEP